MKTLSSLALLSLVFQQAFAVVIPFTRRTLGGKVPSVNFLAPLDIDTFGPPGNTSSQRAPSGNGGVENVNDLMYFTKLQLANHTFNFLLDTGSADLWVQPPSRINGSTLYNERATINYAIGSASGRISRADLKIGSFELSRQAYVTADSTSSLQSLFESGINGVLGLGFDGLSSIRQVVSSTIGETWGSSVLQRLFGPNGPNARRRIIAFRLDRAADSEDTSGGSFTIGEIDAKYAAVDRTEALTLLPKDSRRWSIGVERFVAQNQNVSLVSSVPSVPPGVTVAVLDTGTSLSYGPRAAVDRVYKSIEGARYLQDSDVYALPCDAKPRLSLYFGGQKIVVHPLDLSLVTSGTLPNGTSVSLCISAYRTYAFSTGQGEFDHLLGANFLRNVYSVFDFGQPNSTLTQVKLLSLTNETLIDEEFDTIRARTLRDLPPVVEPSALVASLAANRR